VEAMAAVKTKSINFSPKIALTISLLITMMLFVVFGYLIWRSYKESKSTQQLTLRLRALNGIILHYDEVLTMSARMAAATGELKWVERHRQYEPLLDAAIKEAKKMAPETFMTEAAAMIDSANVILVAMENQSFNLIQAGNAEAARVLLSSVNYEKEKLLYHRGIEQISQGLENRIQASIKRRYRQGLFAVISVTAVVPVLLLIWLLVLRTLGTYIADLKRTEEELRQSENRYRSLFNNNHSIMLLVDPENGDIVDANPAAITFYGWSYQELIGKKISRLNIITNEQVFQEMQRAKTEERQQFYFSHLLSSGEIRDVEVYSGPITVNDRKLLYSIVHDITERKRAEDALRESQEKIERLKKMESLGLLAGGVAHDLNNVLSGVVTYPELLLLNLAEDDKLRKPIETILEAGNRAVAIVQDLLTVARGVATVKEPLSLNDIIKDYLHTPEFHKFKEYYPAVTFKTNLHKGLLNIAGSHAHIRKVVMDLVSNASEAVAGSGNVAISTANRYIDKPLKGYDDVRTGEYVVLAVSDDGSRITSEDLERIFEPFYTKKVMGRSGTGLGLAVVWNVVQDHEGYIDVQSNENGTTFELYFPITREAFADRESSPPIGDYKGAGETILVVDDVETQREIACNMLNTLGYKSEAVSSGEEAVKYLQEHTVDLILLDMIMDPGINGRETYERVIKIHPNQKAVIASGFAETDEVREAQKLGAGRFVKKPFTLEKIGFAIKYELKK
jgi:PAS domain S-box-containing protein